MDKEIRGGGDGPSEGLSTKRETKDLAFVRNGASGEREAFEIFFFGGGGGSLKGPLERFDGDMARGGPSITWVDLRRRQSAIG